MMGDAAAKVVLIAEDEAPLRHAMEQKLLHENIKVQTAVSGDEVLTMVDKVGYDLILLDLVMPGFDGFKVLEKLKENGDTTPVIVLTNLGQIEDKKKALSLGARAVYVKSDISISKIVEEVKKVL